MEIIIFLCIWLIIYNILYSPKAQIRLIRRQIYRTPIKMARAKKQWPDQADHFDAICNKALHIRYKLIDSLLNYHFDLKEDKEYIEKIRNILPFDMREHIT